MSAAAAAAEAPAPNKSKKKLIIIIAVAVLVLVIGGVGAMLLLKKNTAAGDTHAEGEDGQAASESDQESGKSGARRDPKILPVFVPLEPFTVNLADRDAERYVQVGITLEVDNPKTGDLIKTYMPAIRNNVLMALSERTAGELMDRDGKTELANRVLRETARALGYEVAEEADPDAAPRPARKKKAPAPELPIVAVHFSNFIIQ